MSIVLVVFIIRAEGKRRSETSSTTKQTNRYIRGKC